MRRFLSLLALLLSVVGCSTTSSASGAAAMPRRPADRPVIEKKLIDKLSGEELTEARSFVKDGHTLPYRIHLPTNAEEGVIYPLVLFLHGSGECGDDNKKQLVHGVVPICRYAMKHGDAIVVAPQCPLGQRWVNQQWGTSSIRVTPLPSLSMYLTMCLLDELTVTLPVDRTRIYVTGLSMGGYGTWDIAARRSKLFAAAMPICGGVDERTASLFKDVGLRFFHGEKDAAVPVAFSRRMDAALTMADVPHGYTEYPNAGHDCWTRTYRNEEVLMWLFSKYRRPSERK